VHKSNGLKNNNKQVISGNDAAGPRLPTDAERIMQRVFGSDGLLGTAQLALTSDFYSFIGL